MVFYHTGCKIATVLSKNLFKAHRLPRTQEKQIGFFDIFAGDLKQSAAVSPDLSGIDFCTFIYIEAIYIVSFKIYHDETVRLFKKAVNNALKQDIIAVPLP